MRKWGNRETGTRHVIRRGKKFRTVFPSVCLVADMADFIDLTVSSDSEEAPDDNLEWEGKRRTAEITREEGVESDCQIASTLIKEELPPVDMDTDTDFESELKGEGRRDVALEEGAGSDSETTSEQPRFYTTTDSDSPTEFENSCTRLALLIGSALRSLSMLLGSCTGLLVWHPGT